MAKTISPIVIPFKNTTNITIDWGDGTISNHPGGTSFWEATKNFLGDYEDAQHTITITPMSAGGTITFDYQDSIYFYQIQFDTVTQWGDYKCGFGDFYRCEYFTGFTPPSVTLPPPQIGTNVGALFWGCVTFNADISNWDTSEVTLMPGMFLEASAFNQDIGGWDVGKVIYMAQMFISAKAFEADIGSWRPDPSAYAGAADLSSGGMFQGADFFCDDPNGPPHTPWWNGVNNIDPDNNDWSKTNLGC